LRGAADDAASAPPADAASGADAAAMLAFIFAATDER